MLSFKGGVKYIALLMVAGWMFILGVLVGRGTSPVTFDTRNFQERLAVIAKKYQDDSPESGKVELDFYKALNEPVLIERIINDDRPKKEVVVKKITPNQSTMMKTQAVADTGEEKAIDSEVINPDVPVKTSRKHMTVTQNLPETATPKPAGSESVEKKSVTIEIKTEQPPVVVSTDGPKAYTIQVASYPDFKDALAHIAALEKKGVAAYRTLWKNNDQTWYRVRTGAFASMDDAGKYLATLEASGIKGMIIKRTDDENNPE